MTVHVHIHRKSVDASPKLTAKQIEEYRERKDEVKENGKVVGWYVYAINGDATVTKMFIPK